MIKKWVGFWGCGGGGGEQERCRNITYTSCDYNIITSCSGSRASCVERPKKRKKKRELFRPRRHRRLLSTVVSAAIKVACNRQQRTPFALLPAGRRAGPAPCLHRRRYTHALPVHTRVAGDIWIRAAITRARACANNHVRRLYCLFFFFLINSNQLNKSSAASIRTQPRLSCTSLTGSAICTAA